MAIVGWDSESLQEGKKGEARNLPVLVGLLVLIMLRGIL